MSTNLLDLKTDTLNIIGGYVNHDNLEIMKKKLKRHIGICWYKNENRKKKARKWKFQISRRDTRDLI